MAGKKVKRNEQSLQEIWDYVKRPNLRLIGVPECDEENESKLENTLQDIIQENFPNLARQANMQVQEIHRTLQRYSSRRATPRHIIVRFTRVEMKEKMLRAAREKGRVTHKEKPIRLTADLSAETLQARREWGPTFNILKENNFQPRISYPAKLSFISEGKIKFFANKQVLRDYITTRPALQELLKEALHMDGNNQYQPFQKHTKRKLQRIFSLENSHQRDDPLRNAPGAVKTYAVLQKKSDTHPPPIYGSSVKQQLIRKLRWQYGLSLGGRGCSKSRLCHCTPAWKTQPDLVSKKKEKPEKENSPMEGLKPEVNKLLKNKLRGSEGGQSRQIIRAQEFQTSLSNMVKPLSKNIKISLAWWCMPTVPTTWEAETGERLGRWRSRHFGRPRWADHLRPGAGDQPGQDDETSSLLNEQGAAGLHSCCPGWSAMARSQLSATSASQAQDFLNHINFLLLPDSTCQKHVTWKEEEEEERNHQKSNLQPGTVAHAYNPSTLGGQGGQITGGQEFNTGLTNMIIDNKHLAYNEGKNDYQINSAMKKTGLAQLLTLVTPALSDTEAGRSLEPRSSNPA
ncbi:LINE-1 retrotransposable element ORF1 protein [Plecturocebus cupreus]